MATKKHIRELLNIISTLRIDELDFIAAFVDYYRGQIPHPPKLKYPAIPINTCANMPLITSIKKFADSIGVHPRTMHRWVEENIIPSVKIGSRRFINLTEVQKFLETQTNK